VPVEPGPRERAREPREVVTKVTRDDELDLDLAEAFELVARDVRRGDGAAQLSVVEATARAYDTVDPATVYGDDAEAVAYRVVLRRLAQPPSRFELAELIRKLSSERLVELTTLEKYWAYRAQRGEL
jgi:hypothetical protein